MSRRASLLPTFAAVAILIRCSSARRSPTGRLHHAGQHVLNLLDNAYLMVLAVGMTFVILTGGIDLSVGSVMAFTGILAGAAARRRVPAAVAIPVILLAGP